MFVFGICIGILVHVFSIFNTLLKGHWSGQNDLYLYKIILFVIIIKSPCSVSIKLFDYLFLFADVANTGPK